MLKVCCARGVFVLAAILGILANVPSTVSAGPVSNVYVFGDSLLDVGNVYLATGGTNPPSPPYYNGRRSNGPLAVDLFAANYGVTLHPSLTGGNDNAWAGAMAQSSLLSSVPDLIDQVNAFVPGLGASLADPNAIYVLDGGGNDIAAAVLTANPSLINGALAAFQQSLLALAGKGAKNILIYNAQDIGATPSFNGGPGSAPATALTTAFDLGLSSIVAADNAAGIDVDMVDLLALGQAVHANPAAFGFTNVTDACLVGTVVCANPDQYFYWDSFHPTAHTGRLLADAMQSAIPEPGALALVAIALAGLGFSRRKQ